MNVSVIGSEGYLGKSLVPELLRRGHKIRGFDALLWDQPIPMGTDYEFRMASFQQLEPSGWSDVIVLLAALAHDKDGRIPRGKVIQANASQIERYVRRTLKVRPDTRFVIPSSLSIFDKGASAYPSSKRLLERRLTAVGLQHGIDILRYGTLFGVTEDTPPTSFRGHLLLNSMMIDAARTGIISVHGRELSRPVQSLKRAVMHTADRVESPGSEIRNSFLGSGTLHFFGCEVAKFIPAIVRDDEATSRYDVRDFDLSDKRDYALPPFICSNKQARNTLERELRALREYVFRWLPVLLERRASAFPTLYRNLGL